MNRLKDKPFPPPIKNVVLVVTGFNDLGDLFYTNVYTHSEWDWDEDPWIDKECIELDINDFEKNKEYYYWQVLYQNGVFI